MPHSSLSEPAQRPARSSSSGEIGRVHGMHPIERGAQFEFAIAPYVFLLFGALALYYLAVVDRGAFNVRYSSFVTPALYAAFGVAAAGLGHQFTAGARGLDEPEVAIVADNGFFVVGRASHHVAVRVAKEGRAPKLQLVFLTDAVRCHDKDTVGNRMAPQHGFPGGAKDRAAGHTV